MTRLGPQMARALEYIRRNPGCAKLGPASHVCRRGHLYGYRVVNRLIDAGLVRAERVHASLYRLTVSS